MFDRVDLVHSQALLQVEIGEGLSKSVFTEIRDSRKCLAKVRLGFAKIAQKPQ